MQQKTAKKFIGNFETLVTSAAIPSNGTNGANDANEITERTRCEVWTRVMGYHRPVSSWNKGKQAEHRERCYFKETHEAN